MSEWLWAAIGTCLTFLVVAARALVRASQAEKSIEHLDEQFDVFMDEQREFRREMRDSIRRVYDHAEAHDLSDRVSRMEGVLIAKGMADARDFS